MTIQINGKKIKSIISLIAANRGKPASMVRESIRKALEISRQALSLFEKGKCRPTIENLIKLKEFFIRAGFKINRIEDLLIIKRKEFLALRGNKKPGYYIFERCIHTRKEFGLYRRPAEKEYQNKSLPELPDESKKEVK